MTDNSHFLSSYHAPRGLHVHTREILPLLFVSFRTYPFSDILNNFISITIFVADVGFRFQTLIFHGS